MIVGPDLGGLLGVVAAAAQEAPQAGEELVEGERLDDVVVGAGVEPAHPVADRVACGEHEDGRPYAALPERAARLEPVDAGQHDVEHDCVVGRRGRHPEGVLAAPRDVGCVALLAEAPRE